MENNRYAQHKKEIHNICMTEDVDIGVACAMLRQRMDWHFEGGTDTEITEFTAFINAMDSDDREAYFES